MEQQQQQQQIPALPKRTSSASDSESGEKVSVGMADDVSEAKSVSSDDTKNQVSIQEAVMEDSCGGSISGSSGSETSDNDEDFLDLLVDTLDGEFDPNLLL
mmetsp:Transcript_2881/g.4978  ORF Transcript_2881/g.4978 Transcript_2881/m.4978 type:complete len:101 (-) Transcript_2881:213-515(-)